MESGVVLIYFFIGVLGVGILVIVLWMCVCVVVECVFVVDYFGDELWMCGGFFVDDKECGVGVILVE